MAEVATRPSQGTLSFSEKQQRLREATEKYYRDEIDLDQYESALERYEPDYEPIVGAISRLRAGDEVDKADLKLKASRASRLQNAFRALLGVS